MPILDPEVGPYEAGSPEDVQYQQGKLRGLTIPATRLLPAWASMLLPWGETEEGKQVLRPPAAITGGYGGLGVLGPAGVNWLADKAGIKTNLQPLPGAERANELAADNERWALNTIPHVAAQNEAEANVADIALAGSGMALPIPGAAITRLPRVAQIAAHIAVPRGLGGGVVGTALAGGITSYQDTQRDNLLTELGLDPNEVRRQREAADYPDLTQPDTSHDVAHPQTGAAATVPFPISLMGQAQAATTQASEPLPVPPIPPAVVPPQTPSPAPPTEDKYDTLADFGRPDIKVLTPDLHETGDLKSTLGGIALGTAAVIGGASLVMRHGGKVLDPTIKLLTNKGDQINTAGNIAKFNANLDAVDAGRVTGVKPGAPAAAVRGEAPLPGKAGSTMTNIAQKAYDENRVLTEFSNATAPTTGVAKELEAVIGTTNSSTPMMNSIAEQMATGVNQANGGKMMPKLKGILQDVDNLDVRQQAKLDEGLWMKDELNRRVLKFNTAASKGTSLADADIRTNYRNVHSDELRLRVADMENDPATAAIANRLWALQASHAEHSFDMGRLTQQAARDMVRDRPNHVPSVDLEGNVVGPLAFRDEHTLGWETPPTKALDAYTQYYAKLHADLRTNIMHDQLLRNADLHYRADPTKRARVVSEVLDAQGKPVESAPGRTITTYRGGVAHTWNVDNTNLYNAFKGGTARANLFLNTADSLRRALQSGTTGVSASIVGQRPFAFINLNRNIGQIATDRFAGTKFGMADTALQRATGGRLGSRLLEPTQVVGSYNEAIKGSAAVTARYMADSLRREANPVSAALRALKGDAWVEAWATKLEHQWETSNAGMRKAEGASGGGSGGVYERPLYNIAGGKAVSYNPMANAVPGVFHPDGITLPVANVRIPGTKGLTTEYINMRSWMRELHSEISDGANAYYWKGMKADPNISQAQRVYNTRRVVGDPTVHGASKYADWATHTIPWVNPTIQDSVRMMRNLRDNPIAFTLGTVHTLGMMAAASVLSAMLGGKRHLGILGHHISTHDRASNMTFFHDPNDEHNYTQFSLPQRWRVLYPIILQAVTDGLGALNVHQGEDAYNRIVHSLIDLFDTHVSHSTAIASGEGLADAATLGVPPVVQVGATLFGKQVNDPLGQIVKNAATGKPLVSDIVTNRDQASRLPGRAATSTLVSNDDANWAHQVLRGIFGTAGEGFYNHFRNFTSRLDVTHDIAEAFGGVVSDAGQTWRDNAPFGNMIWGNNVKMTTRNPIADANDAAWRVISNPGFPTSKDITAAGVSRPGGVAVNRSEQPKINSDPAIVQMVTVVNNYKHLISSTVQPQLTDVNAQLRDIDNDPYFSAQDKRTLHNNMTMKKNELESQKSLLITKLNAELSVLAGGKHVNVSSFKPAQGMEQFHD